VKFRYYFIVIIIFYLYSYGQHLAQLSFPTRRSSDLVARHLVEDHRVCVIQVPLIGVKGGHHHLPAVGQPGEVARRGGGEYLRARSEEHTSELQSRFDIVCRLLLDKKKNF